MRTAPYPDVPPDFGHWLAGFIDGEGCFYIRRDGRRPSAFQCAARVGLRDDDHQVIEEIHRRTGIGNVSRNDWHHRQRATNQPTVSWNITSKADCLRLIELLDRYPLRSKKARDYAIWREGVQTWMTVSEPPGARRGQKGGRAMYDWQRLDELQVELAATRAYR